VINGDVLFATTGLSLLAELRFRLKGGYGYVSVWAHVFFLKYNPLRAHADCRIRIELRSRSRSSPQRQAEPRDQIGRKNSFELWLAELVFPRGPEPKHRYEDERCTMITIQLLSEMGFSPFTFSH